jgi:serine/threonine-protein kinase
LGIVHRDIKPSNPFAGQAGRRHDYLRVLDFGLVKDPGAQDGFATRPGGAAGTPAFMAPEAFLGRDLDGRADLDSLGCAGYYLLTGSMVFQRRPVKAVRIAHIAEAPRRPSEATESFAPEDLEEIILRLLAKAPGERPARAQRLSGRLGLCVSAAGQGAAAQRPARAQRLSGRPGLCGDAGSWSAAKAELWRRERAPPGLG